ncbi:MAG: permease prefix domain 1-containing protein, partial [Bryobacteraceae bacterium]
MRAGSSWGRFRRRFRFLRSESERQRLLWEEMEFHLESIAQDFAAQGMSEVEARAAARRKFGNMTQKSEESRGVWLVRWWSDLAQDLRYAFRGMRRDPGFTVFTILIAGLGIGASSTVFSVVNALLLRPLPFRDPGRLVWIANQEWSTQVSNFLDLREYNRSFSDLAGWSGGGTGDWQLTGAGEPERVTGVSVTQNLFSLLGVDPVLGRSFTEDECRQKANFPQAVPVDIFIPWPLTEETNRRGNTMTIIGRLKPGASVENARPEFTLLAKQMEIQHPPPERNPTVPRLTPLDRRINGRVRPALLVLACAVGVVMLIVCANLSNLQLARLGARQKELAMRAALGAGRFRLLRQMFTESIALSCCGAALGLSLAFAGTSVVAHLSAFNLPLLNSVRIDGNVLAFTLVTAVVTGVLFGVLPALQAPALEIQDALKEGGRGLIAGKRRAWLRNGLVVSEIAFASVLLVGAGLLVRSFVRVLDVDLGFEPEHTAVLRVDSTRISNLAQQNAFLDDMLQRARSIPGVRAAGVSDVLPFAGDRSWQVGAKGHVYPKGQYPPEPYIRMVSDGYFAAAGIRLEAGRGFTEQDRASS